MRCDVSGRWVPSAAAGLAVALAAACSHAPAPPAAAAAAVTVTAARVESGDWPSSTEAGGVLRARLTAAVSSRILAPVVAVHVRAGDRVRKGEVLVDLDAAELQASAARAASALTAADLAVRAADADARGAEAELDLARATHARIQTLHAERSATAQELDEAVARLSAAEARAAAAQAGAEGAAATLDAARAGARAGAIAAAYGQLTAPFDGVVAERRVDPGTTAAPGVPLVIVESPAGLQLEVRLDATRAAAVTAGQPVEVRVDTRADTDVDADPAAVDAPWTPGRVAEVARIDPQAQSFAVKIDVTPGPGWRSGLFGRARFRGPSRRALVAPAGAVLRRGQLALAFVVSPDGYARLRAVRTGEAASGRVEILAGLAAGELVVVAPPASLTDGQRVTTTPPAPAAGSGAAGAGR
jgi:membrane fusion protein, multidrug efflux system